MCHSRPAEPAQTHCSLKLRANRSEYAREHNKECFVCLPRRATPPTSEATCTSAPLLPRLMLLRGRLAVPPRSSGVLGVAGFSTISITL